MIASDVQPNQRLHLESFCEERLRSKSILCFSHTVALWNRPRASACMQGFRLLIQERDDNKMKETTQQQKLTFYLACVCFHFRVAWLQGSRDAKIQGFVSKAFRMLVMLSRFYRPGGWVFSCRNGMRVQTLCSQEFLVSLFSN